MMFFCFEILTYFAMNNSHNRIMCLQVEVNILMRIEKTEIIYFDLDEYIIYTFVDTILIL